HAPALARDLRCLPTRRSSDLPHPPVGRDTCASLSDCGPRGKAVGIPAGGITLADERHAPIPCRMNPPIILVTGASRGIGAAIVRSEEHTSELQSREKLVCRLR